MPSDSSGLRRRAADESAEDSARAGAPAGAADLESGATLPTPVPGAAATVGATLRQRVSVSALICVFAFLFLLFFLATGLWLLQFFGMPRGARAIELVSPRVAKSVGVIIADRDPAPPLARRMFESVSALDLDSSLSPMVQVV